MVSAASAPMAARMGATQAWFAIWCSTSRQARLHMPPVPPVPSVPPVPPVPALQRATKRRPNAST
eukprot:scaffold70532_cov80-Phaeocystis_antarctica.AAC.3